LNRSKLRGIVPHFAIKERTPLEKKKQSLQKAHNTGRFQFLQQLMVCLIMGNKLKPAGNVEQNRFAIAFCREL